MSSSEEERERGMRERPHGDSRERSRWVTDRKQVGRWKRSSRTLPRRVKWVRVRRSMASHFRLTRDAEFRDRTSETKLSMLAKITSGKSWIVAAIFVDW